MRQIWNAPGAHSMKSSRDQARRLLKNARMKSSCWKAISGLQPMLRLPTGSDIVCSAFSDTVRKLATPITRAGSSTTSRIALRSASGSKIVSASTQHT